MPLIEKHLQQEWMKETAKQKQKCSSLFKYLSGKLTKAVCTFHGPTALSSHSFTNTWKWCYIFLFPNSLLISVFVCACLISPNVGCPPPHQPTPTGMTHARGRPQLSSSTPGFHSDFLALLLPVPFLHWMGWRVAHWPAYATQGLWNSWLWPESRLHSKSYYCSVCTTSLLTLPAHTHTHREKVSV